MKIRSLFFAAALLGLTGLAAAQQMMIKPIKLAPQVSTQTAAQPLQVVETDPEKAALREELRKQRIENRRLEQERAALATQVYDFTALGGSNVHAYCPNPATSRNTSGAENNCAAAGYNCDAVSGLCRNTCQTSDMCTPGFLCCPTKQACVPANNPPEDC